MARPDPPVHRGDIHWIDWNPAHGSEQAGRRPGLVVQNDIANRNPNYPNTIVLAMSSQGRDIPVHVHVLPSQINGLQQEGYIKCEQIMTIAKNRLMGKVAHLDDEDMAAVDAAVKISLGLS